jgi:hypothetical protein
MDVRRPAPYMIGRDDQMAVGSSREREANVDAADSALKTTSSQPIIASDDGNVVLGAENGGVILGRNGGVLCLS